MLVACWALFPLVLLVLCAGAGLAVEAVAGRALGVLVVPTGFAGLAVVGCLTTLTSATAPLTMPAFVALALAGFAFTGRRALPAPPAPVAALTAFLCVGAPVLLTGTATFAGYQKLDDTATFMALGDRLLEHGRSLAGLAPSSYEATLAAFLRGGYPVGSLLPWAVGHQLTGQDLAWLVAPYLAFVAALLALAVFALLEDVLPSAWARAGAAALAAQPALLFGLAQWGGVKELCAAALLALVAALAVRAEAAREAVPVAVATAALLGVLSLGGVVWLPVALVPALIVARSRRAPFVLAATTALLAAPAIVNAATFLSPGTRAIVRSDLELGNLLRPLRAPQLLGLWPAGDFRAAASPGWLVAPLLVAAAAAVALGLAHAWRRRTLALLGYVGAAGLGAAVLSLLGSPWIAGKGLATASPAFVATAACGCAALAGRRRVAGAALAGVLAAGVLWSNALQTRDAWLAPRERLAELERIGDRFAGQGPALMTDPEPYGARHFLRALDAEGASELRRRPVTLRDGAVLEKGAYADLDAVAPAALAPYRLLVLRRSPAASRPGPAFTLVEHGRFYDVWQRSALGPQAPQLPLGGAVQAAAVPPCRAVRALARSGTLVAASRAANVAVALASGAPAGGLHPDEAGYLTGTSGSASVTIAVPRAGRWRIWVGGSLRGRLRAWADERPAGAAERELNPAGQYVELGVVALAAGRHDIELHLDRPALRSGVGGPPDVLGPLVLEPAAAAPGPVTGDARALCGRRLDWVAVR